MYNTSPAYLNEKNCVCERFKKAERERRGDGQFYCDVSPSCLISLLSSPALHVRAVSFLFMTLYLT